MSSEQPSSLLVAVVTTRDDLSIRFGRAKSDLDKAQSVGTKRLIEEHETGGTVSGSGSFVYLPDKPFLNKHGRSASICSHAAGEGRIAPGLFARGPGRITAVWQRLHWDYNMQNGGGHIRATTWSKRSPIMRRSGR